jgi:hypothetical protein
MRGVWRNSVLREPGGRTKREKLFQAVAVRAWE